MGDVTKMEVRVGIADASIVTAPNTIATIGLGSCVGVAIYDNKNKVMGLIHIMLPDSTSFRNVTNPYKFADIGIPKVVEELRQKGCQKRNLTAKIAGGASMFKFAEKSINSDIGNRNIIAVKAAMEKEGISIISEDVGGSKGRSMFANADTGEISIRIVGEGIKVI